MRSIDCCLSRLSYSRSRRLACQEKRVDIGYSIEDQRVDEVGAKSNDEEGGVDAPASEKLFYVVIELLEQRCHYA